MSTSVFEINNLRCGYRPQDVVLEVSNLRIPRGKLVFIVGVSGGGKSTLIETLGLMNETTGHQGLGGEVSYQAIDGKRHRILDFWGEGDQALSTFRQHHFSFIFQQTNLMPNFSAGENMLITALFAGQETDKAEQKVRSLMKAIELPERAFNAGIEELSGGQRQRLAFIRALVADFQVLFGDEPTGNLDNATARKCFTLLRKEIHDSGKSGVIVTHDLPIATEFGDQIIPISLHQSPDGKLRGRINTGRMLFASGEGTMVTAAGDQVDDPAKYLERHIFNATQ